MTSPTSAAPAWAIEEWERLAEICRATLRQDGAAAEAIEHIVADMRPRMIDIFVESAPKQPIPMPHESIQKVKDVLWQQLRGCAVVILRLEAELYWQKVGDPRSGARRERDAIMELAVPGGRVN